MNIDITSKKWVVVYWVATLWVGVTNGAAGVVDILRLQPLFGMLTHLGYPGYFGPILGVWKVLGAIALLAPRFPRLKEWAYAGFFFDFSSATLSYWAVGDGVNQWAGPFFSLIFLLASWALRPATRRM